MGDGVFFLLPQLTVIAWTSLLPFQEYWGYGLSRKVHSVTSPILHWQSMLLASGHQYDVRHNASLTNPKTLSCASCFFRRCTLCPRMEKSAR